MSGDYTRFTFKPSKNYSAVLKQQGRVGLDADWNEGVEIGDRRFRAETVDLRGRCWIGGETPDAFRVDSPAPGVLTIGAGRLYVDGLLAENHGAEPDGAEPYDAFDPVLAEAASGRPLPYEDQPYRLDPEPVEPADGRTDLLYLDVWQREVSALQDAGIRDRALGGPDTATRVQTVWQVRALRSVEAKGCDEPIDEWDAVTQPSGGRLTTSAVAPPASEDPCVVSTAGGYRGTENRLYRVEIHRGGGLGAARFKWSRDNASVVSRVEAIREVGGDFELRLSSLGRDEQLRFKVGNLVEVVDDRRELEGVAGEMAEVRAVDQANRQLKVAPAAAASWDFDPGIEERNTRVVRWDHGSGEPERLLAVEAGPVELEQGVRVAFNLDRASNPLRVGDHWVFAARTADGSVEELVEAPPRGIHHHYCRLALVRWGAGGKAEPEDCRPHGRSAGAGCCTVVVHPGESIQAAIDSLPEEGGCVCLKPGAHRITAPIEIRRSNVTLHGETRGARVVRDNGIALLKAGSDHGIIDNVAVRSIELASAGSDSSDGVALVSMIGVDHATVEDCRLIIESELEIEWPNPLGVPVTVTIPYPQFAVGILCRNCDSLRIAHNLLESFTIGLLGRKGDSSLVVDNTVLGPLGRVPATPGQEEYEIHFGPSGGIVLERGGYIGRNRVENYAVGVAAGGLFSEIAHNQIFRFTLAGVLWPGEDEGIGPEVLLALRRVVGILVWQSFSVVRDNQIFLGEGTIVPPPIPDGTVEFGAMGIDARSLGGSSLEGIRINENTVSVLSSAGVGINMEGTGSIVAGNLVSKCSWAGISLSSGRHNVVSGNQLYSCGTGLRASGEASLEVSGNLFQGLFRSAVDGRDLLEGITLLRNRCLNCGYDHDSRPLAFYLQNVQGNVTIESSEVLDTGIREDGKASWAAAWGIWINRASSCRIAGNRVGYSDPDQLDGSLEHRALVVAGPIAPRASERSFRSSGSASITGNRFHGPGLSHLVEIQHDVNSRADLRFKKILFSHNDCEHLSTGPDSATVTLWGDRAIVIGNHVEADRRTVSSIDFNNIRRVAVTGNVTSGDLVNLPNPKPSEVDEHNV